MRAYIYYLIQCGVTQVPRVLKVKCNLQYPTVLPYCRGSKSLLGEGGIGTATKIEI